MSIRLKIAAAWETLVSLWLKMGGSWSQAESAWVKVAGTWQKVYEAISYNLAGQNDIVDLAVGTARAGIRINADGTIDKREGSTYTQIDAATDWCIPNAKVTGNEQFYCTDNNANIDAGSSAAATWLSPPCEWFVANATTTPKALSLTVQVRKAVGEAAEDSGLYTGTATSEP